MGSWGGGGGGHLFGLAVKASTLRAAVLGFMPAFPVGLLPGRVIPVT